MEKLEEFFKHLKEVQAIDSRIEILEDEIKDNLFDKTEETYINFKLVKKQLTEINKASTMGVLEAIMKSDGPRLDVEVTNVEYSEEFSVSEETAIQIQMLLLKELQDARKKAIEKAKVYESYIA